MGIVVLLILFLIGELFPWGNFIPAFAETNPPVRTQIQWNTPQTEQLVRRYCYDCHSNETTWPWYAHVTPISWLVAHDVNEGRQNLNFSTESARQIDLERVVNAVQSGEMPKRIYTVIHGTPTDAERAALIAGLRASD
ncbi:MAG TPA: heme-binding domain-containing protein [Phototrophicaceae bacterium]|nr:heme-binding domain-containing protein [Phototrophicaceae bacterium]